MRLFYFLLFFFFPFIAMAQQAAMGSIQSIGGNGTDQILNHVTNTSDGGFILSIGSNSAVGTGNIDSFCNLGGNRGVYMKYSADGTLEWHKCFTTGGYIFPLNNGDFIYGTSSHSPTGGWIFAFGREDSLGNMISQRTYGNNADAKLKDMVATNDGGYIMFGETNTSNPNTKQCAI